MNPSQTQTRLHPLVAVACASVLMVSLLASAAITGLLPSSHSNSPAPAALPQVSPAPAPVPLVQTVTTPVAVKPQPAPRVHRVAQAAQPAQHATRCHDCATVLAVNTIQAPVQQTSGLGAVAGAVLGGVLGNQVGGGNGKKIATVAGVIGGGFAGNEVEKRTRSQTTYDIKVKMANGSIRHFQQTSEPNWQAGDKVRIENGHLLRQV